VLLSSNRQQQQIVHVLICLVFGQTFSLANGYSVYVNGNFYGTTGYYSYGGTSWVITWLQVGYNFACSSAYISNAPYQDIIDEIYLHN